MHLGRAFGYALLGLVDAFVPAAIVASLAHEVTLYTALPALRVTAAAAGLALAVGVVLGAVAAVRGGKPFPLTRGAAGVWKRHLWWF